jgi:flagellar basal-body rod protein FlgC
VGNFSSFNISASGLSAQRQRMDAISNNIANANTTRTPEGGPYKRQETVFAAKMEEVEPGVFRPNGVDTPATVADSSPPKLVYEPGHPDADASGYVRMPNVNIVQEMVDMISATRAYEANVTALNSGKTMIAKALEIGRG